MRGREKRLSDKQRKNISLKDKKMGANALGSPFIKKIHIINRKECEPPLS